jgi:hypothetical protein
MSQLRGVGFKGALPINPTEAGETEQQLLAAAFCEIYNNNQNLMDRQALCKHVYGILLALMQKPYLRQSPGNRFFVNEEGKVFFIDSRSNETNRARRLVPVETNAEFEKNLQLQTNPENLESEEQQPVAELDRCDSVVQKILEILHTAESFPDHSPVKELVLQVFNDLNTRLQSLQWELQQKLPENQNQVVEKAKLAKEIGDWLLKQIEQGNST